MRERQYSCVFRMPDRRVSPIAASGLPVRFWLLKVRSSTLSSRNILEQPKYPPEARRARVEGVVILEATVTAEGTVDKVKVISGPPILTGAAVEALTHWKYEPPSSSCHPDGQNQLLAWRHSPVKSLSYVLGQN